ncbi:hypothetical protein [Algiphilus aromaticivorans]|uniref:hypothetical protein n=1 Tax=Algiphilus aromaticivorans TaxID=382454 RepID=UPI0005C13ED9|nr:hypothetical protein [Algiphilus aromaticivorans]
MTRADSIANALTGDEAREAVRMVLRAAEAALLHRSLRRFFAGVRDAVDYAEQAAGANEEWHRLAAQADPARRRIPRRQSRRRQACG